MHAVNTYSALAYLPWCMKIFFGVLSDTTPISGKHRMPYLVGGWVVFIACNLYVYTQVRVKVIERVCVATYAMLAMCSH